MNYKGLNIDPQLAPLIRHMPQVDDFRETIGRLQAVWDNLALLGQLSGVGREMGTTRESFFELSQALVNHLGREHWQRLNQVMAMKALVATEMMQRNLFERTADIGFLATDQILADFLTNPEAQTDLKARTQLTKHLQAYIANYSVYNNVMLLDQNAKIVFQLSDTGVKHSTDERVLSALSTSDPYVEIFGKCDLLPQQQAHIYAYRITNDAQQVLGILCLCFNFQDECQRIFAELDDGDWSVLTLADQQGNIIASSDPQQVNLGMQLKLATHATASIQRIAGRKYLTLARSGKGYQGYRGQNWLGLVFVPLEFAFEPNAQPLDAITPMEGLAIFSSELMAIPAQADRIQINLNRSVWNGSLHQHLAQNETLFSRALLLEISETGLRTKDIFAQAIQELYHTVIGATLANNRFLASLAINIMDRNLYERANDCRWWALTDSFRQSLSQTHIDDSTRQALSAQLSMINQLYTVYTGILLYDKQGKVVAVSQPELLPYVEQSLNESWVSKSLALKQSHDYVVSDFVPTRLYQDRPTYIYAAAIFHPTQTQQVVGGIGLIFDSQPQFQAMLSDAQPSHEDHPTFSLFLDPQRQVIASTNDLFQSGELLPLDLSEAFQQGYAIVNCRDGRYAVGIAQASGYREYPSHLAAEQGYAAIFSRIGELSDTTSTPSLPRQRSATLSTPKASEPTQSIATFRVGQQYFALPVECVVESVDLSLMRQGVPSDHPAFTGYLSHQNRVIPVINPTSLVGQRLLNEQPQLIVIEQTNIRFALMVDHLGQVMHLSADSIAPSPSNLGQGLIKGLIGMEYENNDMIMLMDATKLLQQLIA